MRWDQKRRLFLGGGGGGFIVMVCYEMVNLYVNHMIQMYSLNAKRKSLWIKASAKCINVSFKCICLPNSGYVVFKCTIGSILSSVAVFSFCPFFSVAVLYKGRRYERVT